MTILSLARKYSNIFGISLAYSYFELRSKVLSLDNKNKNTFLFCIVLAYSYLCSQKAAKLLTLGH